MKPKHHEEQNPANDGHDQREGTDNQAHNRHHSDPMELKVKALNDQLRDIFQYVPTRPYVFILRCVVSFQSIENHQ